MCYVQVGRLTSAVSGGKQILGRLLVGTAESIPPEELVDTTGAGDAFVGGIIYCEYSFKPARFSLANLRCQDLDSSCGSFQHYVLVIQWRRCCRLLQPWLVHFYNLTMCSTNWHSAFLSHGGTG